MKLTLAFLLIVPVFAVRAQVPGVPKAPSLGLTIGVKATTLGLGPEIGYSFAPRLGVRVGGQWATVNHDVTISSILYAGSLKWRSFDGLLDLHLFGPLRFSVGAVHNGNQIEVTAHPTTVVTIGGTQYAPSSVGSLTGTIAFKKVAPYAGFGLASGGRVGLIFEFGAMYEGKPTVSLTGTTTLTGAAQTQFYAEVQNQQTKMQQDLNGQSLVKVWPVLGVGLQVKI